MITIRRADERGHTAIDWLSSHHTFSFGGYQDPKHMGVGNLRVLNDDTVAPGGGFATHGHRDMEIISCVLEGALEHKDSMGNGSVIRPGDVQRMSAGTGVQHSEFNHSSSQPVHFLQIWLQPNRLGVEPAYDQCHFDPAERLGRPMLLVSPDGRDDSIATHQDALMYGVLLDSGQTASLDLATDRLGYVHVASGAVGIGAMVLAAGDGACLEREPTLTLTGTEAADVLVFDLPTRGT